jgi:hypothetical protein
MGQKKVEWHRVRAADCEHLAKTALNEWAKAVLHDMPAGWNKLALLLRNGSWPERILLLGLASWPGAKFSPRTGS